MEKEKTPPLHIFGDTIAMFPELKAWLAGMPKRKKTEKVIVVLLAHIAKEKSKAKS